MNKRIISLILAIFILGTMFPAIIVSSGKWNYQEVYENNLKIYNSQSTDPAILEFYIFPLKYSNIKKSYDKEITELANSITQNISGDYDKAKAINEWVANNIYYDYDTYYSKDYFSPQYDYSALTVLKTKRGICAGYANLTVALLRAADIPAKFIVGDVSSSDEGHAWCEAFVGGKWIIIDTTWNSMNRYENGAYTQNACTDTYFDISLKDFSVNHKYNDYSVTFTYYDLKLYVSDLTSLTEITIPDGVVSIGSYAFYNCKNLSKITLPDSVTVIADHAFYNCRGLNSITLPDSVTSIGEYAFSDCRSLSEITLPIGVTSIEKSTFSGCHNLTDITLPGSVTFIGGGAFYQCTSLSGIMLPNSVTFIGSGAFSGCTSLAGITLPDGISSIEINAFANCTGMTRITIPDSVVSIEKYAFRYCGNLTIYGDPGSYTEKYAKDNDIKFVDRLATANDWARDSIKSAIKKGFVPANIQDNYKSVITRVEFCRMAVKFVEYATGKSIDEILKEKGVSRNQNTFSDTKDPDILAAYALGITNGTGGGKFTPGGLFNRQQAATMLMRVCDIIGMNINNPPDSGFTDLNMADSWAVDAINFCYVNNIMIGTGNNHFSPKEAYTRQQSIMTFDRIK